MHPQTQPVKAGMISLLVFAVAIAGLPLSPARGAEASGSSSKPFATEELAQLVAPVALYPDPLLAQVLMASTYPLEVVQADRWTKKNKELKGKALTAKLEKENWDPSIKSLVNFPKVLDMMNKELEWTTKLGDAFIADQKKVMKAVQNLRGRARAEGKLKTTKQQKVIVQKETQTIVIEPAKPNVIYVPSYNPVVVYGAWPYPAYPPYAVYPAGYYAGRAVAFGVGVATAAAWGYAWGGCRWGHGDIDINHNRNSNLNRNIHSRPQ